MKKTVIFLFLILCMTAVNTGCQKKQETDFILETPKEHTDNEKQTEGNKDIKEGKSDSEKEKSTENIFVYVCGAVQKPGVYEFLPGQRICDAIAAAGGLSEQAAGDSLNQAEVLSDGQMLRVLTTEEAAATTVQPGQETAESSRDGRVDINTADASALMSLPGIGQSKADAIIAYRNEHGAFKAPEELMNISGIKEGVYQKIKDSIKVN